MHQPTLGKPHVKPNITLNDQRLDAVDEFTYPGSILSRNVMIDVEVNARLAKASVAIGRLYKNVWTSRGIIKETKTKVYRVVVFTTLLYSCEGWAVYRSVKSSTAAAIHCTHCSRLFQVRIGLIGHFHTHLTNHPPPPNRR